MVVVLRVLSLCSILSLYAGCGSTLAPADSPENESARVVLYNASSGTIRVFDERSMIDYLPVDASDTLLIAKQTRLVARWYTGNRAVTLTVTGDTTWQLQ